MPSTSSSTRPVAGRARSRSSPSGRSRTSPSRSCASRRCPRLLKGYVLMGGAFGVIGQHDPDDRVEHPLRPRRGQDRLSRLGRRDRRRPVDPAAARARPRRHRAGPHPARARRAPRPPRRQHARTTRSPSRAARTRCRPTRSVASQPDRPLRRRRAALLLRVPRAVRRLLRRVHPRSAGRRGDARSRRSSRPRPSFVDVETRGELTTGMTVADRRGLTGQAAEPRCGGRARDVATFLDRLIERIGGLAADRVRRGTLAHGGNAARSSGRRRWSGGRPSP